MQDKNCLVTKQMCKLNGNNASVSETEVAKWNITMNFGMTWQSI